MVMISVSHFCINEHVYIFNMGVWVFFVFCFVNVGKVPRDNEYIFNVGVTAFIL